MTSTVATDQEDDRYETEEFLVYVDLDTKLLDDQLSKSSTKIKFLGIDTENPIMQLNNQLFKGEYEYSMGTHCFFSESKRPGGIEDACFKEMPSKLYDYFAKTNKVLKMKRIFVEEKESEGSAELAEGEIEDFEHLRISKTYAEALNQFLKPGEQPPRDLSQEQAEQDVMAEREEDQTDEEDEHRMEVEEIRQDIGANAESTDERSEDRTTEDSENTKILKIEKHAHAEFERLTHLENSPRK
ncbi:general transcription factor 3C polypeptide 6 [Contarinia nasturtii]|uniref:general transcription factor 3C polypeptide 6 n=1 Tax=Contarinia nasturtii TaxID=265458 RepID=UPI0012D428C9|nr:general transcription factor 3C polypeptide 6 [Contarinia nasturtii]